MSPITDLAAEWLEADGLGGFATGTVAGPRTRRYHGLLVTATTPPTGRQMLVAGLDAWIESTGNREDLTVQRYRPDVQSRSLDHLAAFSADPWPTWNYRLLDGTAVTHELFVPKDRSLVVLRWRLGRPTKGHRLAVRPLLAGRDIHALQQANGDFRFDPLVAANQIRWHPYPGVPGITAHHNGRYRHDPTWYRGFQLDEERARGFDFLEDAAAPGVLSWDLSAGEAVLILAADQAEPVGDPEFDPVEAADRLRTRERRRRGRLTNPLARAADSYVVRRGTGKTIIAGYPWFTDWGRDTFIALRGLCLATGRLNDAKSVVLAWADLESEGMLPNRFLDQGDTAEYNSVDASLWYVIVVGELIAAFAGAGKRLTATDRRRMEDAAQAILEGYATGTRYGIHADRDGLLAAGVAGIQLTWMDAKVGDWVVTPRVGKPVEVQALWLAALVAGQASNNRWRLLANQVREAFVARFWNPDRQCLYDVVDCDGEAGRVDPSVRPNQIFAVGGLPQSLLSGDRATAVVEMVERELLTPLGLRTLAPSDPRYVPRYQGGPRERDGAYHQGTVWPWLLGPFVEAWLRVRGNTPATRQEGRSRFLAPLLLHLREAGIGHVSEIADGLAPHVPRGCPFQAWSVGEAIRIERLLTEPTRGPV